MTLPVGVGSVGVRAVRAVGEWPVNRRVTAARGAGRGSGADMTEPPAGAGGPVGECLGGGRDTGRRVTGADLGGP